MLKFKWRERLLVNQHGPLGPKFGEVSRDSHCQSLQCAVPKTCHLTLLPFLTWALKHSSMFPLTQEVRPHFFGPMGTTGPLAERATGSSASALIRPDKWPEWDDLSLSSLPGVWSWGRLHSKNVCLMWSLTFIIEVPSQNPITHSIPSCLISQDAASVSEIAVTLSLARSLDYGLGLRLQ